MSNKSSTLRVPRSFTNLLFNGVVLLSLNQSSSASATEVRYVTSSTTSSRTVVSDIRRMYDLMRMRTCAALGIPYHP